MQHWTSAVLFEHYEDLERARTHVVTELKSRNVDWQHFAQYGLTAQATQLYREKYKTDLREAFDAIRAFCKEVKE